MKFLCENKFLIFPASQKAEDKRVLFYIDEELVYDLVIPLDYDNPDYKFPLDVKRFIGKELRIECVDNSDVLFEVADERTDVYDGNYRPLAHFTAKRGWINDPNGLVYYNNKYHMFFQHNPVDCKWGNMHWGHAISEDLIHWQEKDIVFFPDEGGTYFSGSAIVDWKNVTGLKQNENDVILLFYTLAGGTSETSKCKPFVQNMAYSVDGGETFIKYKKNPVLKNIINENRDPKVVYCEADDSYIMALFLDGHEYAIFKSKNLLDWEELQRVVMDEDWECPDFFPLAVDGNPDNIKWIFIGAYDRYYIGDFDGRKYTNLSELKQLNYGHSSYASQSWSDLPGGRRVRTGFSSIIIPGEPYACCLNVPQEMSLKTIDGETKLCVEPVKEVETLYLDIKREINLVDNRVLSGTKSLEKNIRSYSKKTVDCKNIDSEKNYTESHADSFEESNIETLNYSPESKCCDIDITAPMTESFEFSLYGFDLSYDSANNLIKCMDKEVSACGDNNMLSIRLIIDTINTEVFIDNGSIFMGMSHTQNNNNLLRLSARNLDGASVKIAEMKCFWE